MLAVWQQMRFPPVGGHGLTSLWPISFEK